jgi:hypothetical protein
MLTINSYPPLFGVADDNGSTAKCIARRPDMQGL